MEALPTNRIPGIDAVSEFLAQRVETGDLSALHLGLAGDGTPIFAVGKNIDSANQTLLLIGAGSGDSVLGIAAACRFLTEQAADFPEWNIWTISSLDVPRLRQNVSQLGQLKPSPKEHLLARRLPWGPGENPEHNLPIDNEPFLQPDHYPESEDIPEDIVASSAESVALARALEYLNPDLVLSLKDRPVGGAFIASSQAMKSSDTKRLLEVLLGDLAGIHRGQLLHPGLAEPDQPGLIRLLSMEEQADSSASPDDWQLGGGATWQVLLERNPQALYLAAFLPRLSHPDLSSELSSDCCNDVVLHTEVRTVNGTEKMVLVTKLDQPDHPAHEKELRVDIVPEGETPRTGEVKGQPAALGSIAAQAIWERQHIISKVLESFSSALDHFETPDHQRALQLLKNEHRQDNALRNFQSSKKHGVIATRAEAYYWNTVYRFQTAEILQESLRCIEGESLVDREIIQTRDVLQEWIDNQLAYCQSLHSLPALKLSNQLQDFIGAALLVVKAGGPTLVRAELKVQAAEKKLHAAQLKAKESKAAGHPRAERQAALDVAEVAQIKLQQAQELLQGLLQAEDAAGNDAPELLIQDAVVENDTPELLVEDAVVDNDAPELLVQDAAVENDIPELLIEDANTETDTPELLIQDAVVGNDAPELLVGDAVVENDIPELQMQDVNKEAEVAPPPLPPMPEASKPEPIVVGDEKAADRTINVEDMLPDKLEIPKEWGRGAMHWERQIPRMGEAPLMREMMNKLLSQGQAAVPRGPAAQQGEIEETKPVGTSLQEPSNPGTVAAANTQSVGFVRHRVGADSRYIPSPIPPPTPLPNSGGIFQMHSQRRIEPNSGQSQ